VFTEWLPSNDREIHKQQVDFIGLLLFFQNELRRLKIDSPLPEIESSVVQPVA
jgi:hypothetical protein